ncbi:MAG: hypothetical protein D6722_01895 [Bacteroidetes bacterium]|nr:MAG: hypothetical protein D6722_01895 [Bacteroidota bacterium]
MAISRETFLRTGLLGGLGFPKYQTTVILPPNRDCFIVHQGDSMFIYQCNWDDPETYTEALTSFRELEKLVNAGKYACGPLRAKASQDPGGTIPNTIRWRPQSPSQAYTNMVIIARIQEYPNIFEGPEAKFYSVTLEVSRIW